LQKKTFLSSQQVMDVLVCWRCDFKHMVYVFTVGDNIRLNVTRYTMACFTWEYYLKILLYIQLSCLMVISHC